jgi:hypothetical protein
VLRGRIGGVLAIADYGKALSTLPGIEADSMRWFDDNRSAMVKNILL